ncbi:protein FAM124A-like [Dendronephthya gigantea]|uniref:protein FAM124A-like n=1 Tax=Dendronephthya gigantea TaxID=151771 RepID=UPI00106AF700|nr:protein FAM124A-like [Dendronephthya gigantea]
MGETTCYCSIAVCIEQKNPEIEQLLQDYLKEIRLPFNILEFGNSGNFTTEPNEALKIRSLEENSAQSHAICFFLKEDTDLEFTLKSHLEGLPWELDHVIESSRIERPRTIARQEFYRCSYDMPLISVGSVHYGNEHVRFHINVKNFHAMKVFYESITDRKAKDCGPDFCFLTTYSEDGLDVQIGLKKNSTVLPLRSSLFRLKFKVQSASPLFEFLASAQHLSNQSNYILQDPDGNDVIIERSDSKVSNFHCELPNEVDENNNFESKILEESSNSNSRLRKHMWSKNEYSEHGLFPEEAMSSVDGSLSKSEDSESECMVIVNHAYEEHITFV